MAAARRESLEEEKNLSRLLGQQQIELINEFGKPNGVIHKDDDKILIFLTFGYYYKIYNVSYNLKLKNQKHYNLEVEKFDIL